MALAPPASINMIGSAMHEHPLPSSSPLSIEPITMRVPDACRFTGISRSTLYLLIARGEVEVIKLGSATLVLTESLRQLIERHRNAASSLNTNKDPIAPG
ncbi:helix-turn-helix transcriptional regulator [Blastomonas sp. CACIA14H2]|uniref:helix-turn-helix transcriptional regulator n=1 Tax=Blastomonas sp. CACIA14H2 TaxID=1419876 RepID=UPI0040596A2F